MQCTGRGWTSLTTSIALLISLRLLPVASWQMRLVLASKDLPLTMSPCPNLAGGPNHGPTSRGGWGHEKPFKNNGVPNLTTWSQPLLHIYVGERKRSGTCFSIRKEKDPRWGHRGWDHIRSSDWSETIKGCPNPLEGWDHAFQGWDRGGQRIDLRRPRRLGRFRFGRELPDATSCGDRSRRPTACEPSR